MWSAQVNVACSLASSSPLDRRIKHFMMTDLLHLVGINPYDRRRTMAEEDKARRSRLLHGNEQRIKHRNIFELRNTALADLDAHDLDIIATAEDENSRSGGWQRIFPCEAMDKQYLHLFEFPRYRNTVLAKWMERPDWPLLAPLLNPSLPADHPLRTLCVHSVPSDRSSLMSSDRGSSVRKPDAIRRSDQAHQRLRNPDEAQSSAAEEPAEEPEAEEPGNRTVATDITVGKMECAELTAAGDMENNAPTKRITRIDLGALCSTSMACGCRTGERYAVHASASCPSGSSISTALIGGDLGAAAPGQSTPSCGHSRDASLGLSFGGSMASGGSAVAIGGYVGAASCGIEGPALLRPPDSTFALRLHALMRREVELPLPSGV
jgi:hypothetical protein